MNANLFFKLQATERLIGYNNRSAIIYILLYMKYLRIQKGYLLSVNGFGFEKLNVRKWDVIKVCLGGAHFKPERGIAHEFIRRIKMGNAGEWF